MPVLHQEAMLFWGVLYTCPKKLDTIRDILEAHYGAIFYEIHGFPFTVSSYYNDEMGEGLLKSFFFFDSLIAPDIITDIKLFSNEVEVSFGVNGKRIINCDPGYLDMAKVVLPTTKDRDHRIYLRDGIFAEVTLHYRGQSYEGFPWTYPDFATPNYIELFNAMRGVFAEKRSIQKV